MNFEHLPEQDMLRASVAGTFSRGGAHVVPALAALGVFGLLVAPTRGGSGLGMVEATIVLQEAGRAGAGGSLAETMLLADAVIEAMPDLADDMLAGALPLHAPVSDSLRDTGGRLHGNLTLSGPNPAAWFAAHLDGTRVALLPSADFEPEARARIEATSDAYRVVVDVAKAGIPIVCLEAFGQRLAILRCAELLGAAEHCLHLSIAYLKDRQQFGQPIGANQALKHIAADTYLALENIRVAVEYAAAARDAVDAEPNDEAARSEADRAVAVMLSYVPRAAREIAETAVHMHGGIGLTWEYGLNAYLRRIVRLGMSLGAPSKHQLAVFAHFAAAPQPPVASAAGRMEVHHAHAV